MERLLWISDAREAPFVTSDIPVPPLYWRWCIPHIGNQVDTSSSFHAQASRSPAFALLRTRLSSANSAASA